MSRNKQDHECGFCDKNVELIQEIIRGDRIRVIYPQSPTIEENLLLVPIRHVERFEQLSNEEMIELFQVIKKVNKCFNKLYKTTGFNLFVNDGKEAGQHIPHIHFHFFGRLANEKISPFKVLNGQGSYKIKKLSKKEMKERVDKIRKVMVQY